MCHMHCFPCCTRPDHEPRSSLITCNCCRSTVVPRAEAKKGGIWGSNQRSERNKAARERQKADSRLLYDAANKKKGDKLNEEEYSALKRKIGGTARDFFKDWVDVDGDYVDQGFVGANQKTSVPALPFLIAVVLAVLGTAGWVVSQV
jgi:hypothetical protein